MKVRLDLPHIYECLEEPGTVSPQNQFYLEAIEQIKAGEEWKDKKEIPVSPKEIARTIHLGKAILPTPFESVDGHFKRDEGAYAGKVRISIPTYNVDPVKTNETLEIVYTGLRDFFGNDWVQMNPTSGYLIVRGKPKIAVQPSNPFISVSIGDSGIQEAKFGAYETFSKDGMLLESVVDICVNSGIEGAVLRGDMDSNPNLEISLRPVKSL